MNKSDPKSRRRLITPEGVNLQIELADIGARFGALCIDTIIMLVTLIIASFVIFQGAVQIADSDNELGANVGSSLFILVFFFLRSFYFMFFEMGPRAATPGKRLMKIRVSARAAPRLTANAVFARNALREIEFFLPLSFLLSGGADGVDGWIKLLGLIWAGVFMFFPFFNKDNLRAGDLMAGTWVVKAPRPVLAEDIANRAEDLENLYAFTAEQIDAYGVKELHILEDVLREREPETVRDVTFRIKRKIGWSDEGEHRHDLDFLQAYYKALRGRLETKLLMGVRREDKFDRR